MAKQKKLKTPAPDLVSFSELARRAGVSRAAVSLWVKQQESQGVKLSLPSGRRGKAVDANNPLVMRYINNTLGKSNRPVQEGEGKGNKSPNTLRKLEYQAEKLRLQNIALREKYIPRENVWAVLDKLFEFETELFKDHPERVLSRIERELKCTITPESRKQAKEYMEAALERAHKTVRRIIADFKKKTA